MALATGSYASAEGVAVDHPSWNELRGVSYVRRAVAEDTRSAAFPMLRNQAGVGGVGTYWVTLVAGELVEDEAGALTPRGAKLADAFLQSRATPDRAHLVQVIGGKDVQFPTSVLAVWGSAANLGAASPRERQVLADALLEPEAHRRMASAMQATEADTSDGEVLIVTTVGQEGIDLHRECSHVIHHDLPWNPATVEQRTGRVDRIGSKTERLRAKGGGDCFLDVAVPYIAGTYDEHRFRVVHGRAHVFDVTLGGEYAVGGHRNVSDAMEAERIGDDPGQKGTAWAPVPEVIAEDLRLHFEAEMPDA